MKCLVFMRENTIKFYDELIATNPNFERKGKNMIYTSANGYMFSQVNKAGEIGIRLPKASAKVFMETYNASEFRSYGAVMCDYVKIPEMLLDNTKLLSELLQESYEYVISLPPK